MVLVSVLVHSWEEGPTAGGRDPHEGGLPRQLLGMSPPAFDALRTQRLDQVDLSATASVRFSIGAASSLHQPSEAIRVLRTLGLYVSNVSRYARYGYSVSFSLISFPHSVTLALLNSECSARLTGATLASAAKVRSVGFHNLDFYHKVAIIQVSV